MKFNKISIYALLFVWTACKQVNMETNDTQEYSRWVGDISFDPMIDDPNFELCLGEEHVLQYFNFGKGLQYTGEKSTIVDKFNKEYKVIEDNDANGLIRIRFVVNCKGMTDRFRVISSDEDYSEKKFNKKIVDQLVRITKTLDGWKVMSSENYQRDYYQYLIFKMKNGNIIEILP